VTKKTPLTMRQQVVQAAKDADVPIDDWDRAQVLGQLAGLLAAHPSIAGKIAFKGGAVMHLIDGSPRLSRDLDGVLVAAGRVTEATIRNALGTPSARKVVIEVSRFVTTTPDSILFQVITCHPVSGVGRVGVQLSINWQAPLLLTAEPQTVEINKREVTFLVVARLERIAEKVRAFVVRGRAGDAFDLYYYDKTEISKRDRARLPELVATKLSEDPDVPADENLPERLDMFIAELGPKWVDSPLIMKGPRPPWDEVKRRAASFRQYLPERKPQRS
jgi:hypothetical protein